MKKIQTTTHTTSILFYTKSPFGVSVWREDYYPTALVAVADPREVFRLSQVCNHLSQGDRQRVQWLEPPARSSMVGDVVVTDNGVWRFERFGLTLL